MFSFNFHTSEVKMLIFGKQVVLDNTQLVRVISSRSRLNIKATFLKKWLFRKHILLFHNVFKTLFLKVSLSFPSIDDSHCKRIYSFLTAVHCFDNGYVGK